MNLKIASIILVLFMAAGCQQTTQNLPVETPRAQPVEATPPPRVDTIDRSAMNAQPVDTGYREPTDEELRQITTLYFDFDRSEVRQENQSVIAAHSRYLVENPNMRVRLEGHADERGSREYNIGLGERRAQAVRNAMMLQSVRSAQVATYSFGEEKPADGGHSEFSWQQNRRVQIVYY